jgi:hypothetical protein
MGINHGCGFGEDARGLGIEEVADHVVQGSEAGQDGGESPAVSVMRQVEKTWGIIM